MREFAGLDMSEMTDQMLKLRGFIRQKDKNYFVVRVKTQLGNVNSEQLAALSDIAGKYGRSYMTFTTRLNIDIPWVVQENPEAVNRRWKKRIKGWWDWTNCASDCGLQRHDMQ